MSKTAAIGYLIVFATTFAWADQPSPYLGQEQRELKALSPQDVEQYLEGLRGNTVAPLGDGMGHPVVELWTFETVTFNGHSVLPEARGGLFRITDTTTAN